jgi:hypothetical protein
MKVRIARADDLTTLVTLRCAMWPQISSLEHEQVVRRRFDSAVQ